MLNANVTETSPGWFLPREHGAWGIVLIPFFTAIATAREAGPAVWLALLSVLLVFVARYPLELLLLPLAAKRAGHPPRAALWRAFAWYTVAALVAGMTLVVVWKLYVLLLLGLFGGFVFALRIWFGLRGEERSLVAEVIGSAGLTMTALVGWVAATGSVDATGLAIWVLNCAFYCSGSLYVKAKIRARQLGQKTAGYNEVSCALVLQLLLFAFVAALGAFDWVSPLMVVPFALAALRAAWGLYAEEGPFALRRLGWSEVGLSVVFAIFLTAAFTV